MRQAYLFFYLFNKTKLDGIDTYFLIHANSPQMAIAIDEELYKKLQIVKVFSFDVFKSYMASLDYLVTQDAIRYYIDSKKYKAYKRNSYIRMIIVLLLFIFISLIYFIG